MNPGDKKRQSRWLLYAGGACIATGLVVGPLLMSGMIGDSDPRGGSSSATRQPAGPSATDGGATVGVEGSGPDVVSWGQEGRQLAVVVRNDRDQFLDEARVRITGRSASGRVVVSTIGTEYNVCCTVFGLAPGEQFAVYAPIRPGVDKVSDVAVEYVSTDFRAVREEEPRVTASEARLVRTADDTVVSVVLRAEGPVDDFVAAQAVLVGPDGKVAQVISGRYWCYEPGTQRRVRLQLFRAVPDGLHLDKVLAHSIPDGVRTGTKGEC